VRQFVFILFLFTSVFISTAAETNYVCIVCGKGPLAGQVWLHPRGPICDECEKLENRCSLCGLPVRAGDGSVKTGDGRFICRFDKPNAVLDAAAARDVFENTRQDVVDLYGRGFLLKYPDVTVNLFDVDYWSEKGRDNGLDKYGFASTRKTPAGECTHEVVLLSGRLRNEMISTAAHEYTHLWINENCPSNHVIDSDTVEAIKGLRQRRLHKAFLRYHDPENWPVLRDALRAMGRADLIGPGSNHLVPATQPAAGGGRRRPEPTSSRGLKFTTKGVRPR